MIVVYPMLTSGSVSPNVLPGIIKAVERYILIYNTDEVLRSAGATSAGPIISTGATAFAGAAGTAAAGPVGGAIGSKIVGSMFRNSAEIDADGDVLSEAPPPRSIKPSGPTNIGSGRQVNVTLKGATGGGSSGAKPSLDIPRGDAISLEPTWLQVTTRKKGLQILGVKVVPFRIKSSDNITQMLQQDSQLKYLNYLQLKYGRGMVRVFHRLMKKTHLPRLKDRALSGDPRKDILLGRSQYLDNMFLCMSQMDLNSDEVFSSPRGIQKLHKLGWASFIVVDDVNRRTTFCMKEFGGVCSVVPYNFMFTSFGKDFNQAYEDLEDIKKSSGPFFNMKTNRRRLFSDHHTHVDKYMQLIQGK